MSVRSFKFQDGSSISDLVEIPRLLGQEWANTFATPHVTDNENAQYMLTMHPSPFDFSQGRFPCGNFLKQAIRVSKDKAPGPDHIPPAAWRAHVDSSCDTLWEVNTALTLG